MTEGEVQVQESHALVGASLGFQGCADDVGALTSFLLSEGPTYSTGQQPPDADYPLR